MHGALRLLIALERLKMKLGAAFEMKELNSLSNGGSLFHVGQTKVLPPRDSLLIIFIVDLYVCFFELLTFVFI